MQQLTRMKKNYLKPGGKAVNGFNHPEIKGN